MRVRRTPVEVLRLSAPFIRAADAAWHRMHWWIGIMAVLYAVSGTTVVKADEVAVILRWGRLVGGTPAQQEHGPGLLFAFPRPIDRVVRVQVRRVAELPIDTLAPSFGEFGGGYTTLDPLLHGYALTGDRNIVHVAMVARYRIRDAAAWALYGARAEDLLRVEVSAAAVRSIGEMGVDRVLADGRTALAEATIRRAQAGLDAAHAGLELSSLEFTNLSPPAALAYDFNQVQSAFIGAETRRKEAASYASTIVAQAQAYADAVMQGARGVAASDVAAAEGAAAAFVALSREYRSDPVVVRERLYRDAIEKAISSAAGVRWVPPPTGGRYQGLRITIGKGTSNASAPEPH
jgi:membrane protease subunit HflK